MGGATRETCVPSCSETWMASSWSRAPSDFGTHAKKSALASKLEFEKERGEGAESPREASLGRYVGEDVYEEAGSA